ncbi:hypothetical protein [Bartonella doshiae]|uniref:hypothetical protein n=1 Tax=Bartonella doshiae TaxID=33044 RepID=UPI000942F608|nr:hypothetical protein [Bartonella doshiae]
MAFFPFSIADINDPERIRVVIYASGRMGHLPLNALLAKIYTDFNHFNEKQTEGIKQISSRMDAFEEQLKNLQESFEKIKE